MKSLTLVIGLIFLLSVGTFAEDLTKCQKDLETGAKAVAQFIEDAKNLNREGIMKDLSEFGSVVQSIRRGCSRDFLASIFGGERPHLQLERDCDKLISTLDTIVKENANSSDRVKGNGKIVGAGMRSMPHYMMSCTPRGK